MRRNLEIHDDGIDAKVTLDGKQLEGVRYYSVSHDGPDVAEIEISTRGGTYVFEGTVKQKSPKIEIVTRLGVMEALNKHYWLPGNRGMEHICACDKFRVTRRGTDEKGLREVMALHITRILTGTGPADEEIAFEGELDFDIDIQTIGDPRALGGN